jgi:hypothetical protein
VIILVGVLSWISGYLHAGRPDSGGAVPCTSKFIFIREDSMSTKRSYGFWKFCGDVIMTIATAGFWLIWVFVREMRGR